VVHSLPYGWCGTSLYNKSWALAASSLTFNVRRMQSINDHLPCLPHWSIVGRFPDHCRIPPPISIASILLDQTNPFHFNLRTFVSHACEGVSTPAWKFFWPCLEKYNISSLHWLFTKRPDYSLLILEEASNIGLYKYCIPMLCYLSLSPCQHQPSVCIVGCGIPTKLSRKGCSLRSCLGFM